MTCPDISSPGGIAAMASDDAEHSVTASFTLCGIIGAAASTATAEDAEEPCSMES